MKCHLIFSKEILRLSDATFYVCINTIYQFIKPFLDKKKSIFDEYGAFKYLDSNYFIENK